MGLKIAELFGKQEVIEANFLFLTSFKNQVPLEPQRGSAQLIVLSVPFLPKPTAVHIQWQNVSPLSSQ